MAILLRPCLALGLALASLTSLAFAQDTPETSHFEKQVAGNRTIVAFVHGILGDGRSTWTNAAAYWPRMLASDPAFAGADIFVYSYPTGVWATFSVDELAENMRLILSSMSATNYDNIVFIAHSMGGLCCTRLPAEKPHCRWTNKVRLLLFNTYKRQSNCGNTSLAAQSNPQLKKMAPMKADDFLADQVRQWNDAKYKIPTYCAYEKRKTFEQEIVSMMSASFLCTQPLNPIDANHIDIVKPESPNSISYLAFKAAYNEQLAAAVAQTSPAQPPATTTHTEDTAAALSISLPAPLCFLAPTSPCEHRRCAALRAGEGRNRLCGLPIQERYA